MTRRGVLTGGIWVMDRNLMVTHWPQENGFAAVTQDLRCGGGSSYNLGANLKTLDPDLQVTTIGLVGEDDDGAFLVETARAHGIDPSGIRTEKGVRTDYTLAFASEATGRRTHIGAFEAAGRLTPDHFDLSHTSARLLHLGLPGLHKVMDAPWQDEANGWVAVLKRARAAGLATNMELVSIEPARIAKIIRPCLPHLELLVVNDHEIGGLAGHQTVRDDETDVAACLEALRAVMAAGAMSLAAVHFPQGAIAMTRAGEVAAAASVRVPRDYNKGANGAGDAFAAGFVYGWHEGWPLDETLRLAHAVAATSLGDITTTGAVKPWRTCLQLAQEWGFREEGALAGLTRR